MDGNSSTDSLLHHLTSTAATPPNTPPLTLSTLELANVLFYCFVIAFGVVGNIWVAWKVGLILLFPPAINSAASSVNRSLLRCILVICLCDLVVLSTLSLLVDNRVRGSWRFGEYPCKLFYGIELINKFVIPLALVEISKISYAAANASSVKAPVRRRLPLLLINILTIVTFILLLICVLSFSEASRFSYTRRGRRREITVCAFVPPPAYAVGFNGAAFVVGYVLSVLYVYFYLSVPVILQRRSSQSSARALMRVNDSTIGRIKRTVLAFVCIYLVCWTPYWIVFWLASLGILPNWMLAPSLFAHALPYLSCAAYPVMLTCMNDGIREEHSVVMSHKRRQLSTFRSGLFQMLSEMTLLHQTPSVPQPHNNSPSSTSVSNVLTVLPKDTIIPSENILPKDTVIAPEDADTENGSPEAV